MGDRLCEQLKGFLRQFLLSTESSRISLLSYTGMFGITLSFHRQLSHKSFKTPKWLEYLFAYCGVLSVQVRIAAVSAIFCIQSTIGPVCLYFPLPVSSQRTSGLLILVFIILTF